MNSSNSSQKSSFSIDPTGMDVLYSLLDMLNVVGNIIIVVLIYRDHKMKTSTGKLLVNQALADGAIGLIFVVFLLFIRSDEETNVIQRFTGMRVCLNVMYSESFQTLGATAFSLYIAICHPVKFKIYNRTRTVVIFIASTWIINIIVTLLFFATSKAYVHGDMMLFSFYKLKPMDIWYEVLKIVVMFLLPLLAYFSIIKIIMYNHTEEVQAQSDSKKLVRQAIGIIFMMSVYVTLFLTNVILENIHPVNLETEKEGRSPSWDVIIYLYLVLKLPLFLLAFKPYRKVAKILCCPCLARNQVEDLPAGDGTRENRITTNSTERHTLNPEMLHPNWSTTPPCAEARTTVVHQMKIHEKEVDLDDEMAATHSVSRDKIIMHAPGHFSQNVLPAWSGPIDVDNNSSGTSTRTPVIHLSNEGLKLPEGTLVHRPSTSKDDIA